MIRHFKKQNIIKVLIAFILIFAMSVSLVAIAMQNKVNYVGNDMNVVNSSSYVPDTNATLEDGKVVGGSSEYIKSMGYTPSTHTAINNGTELKN